MDDLRPDRRGTYVEFDSYLRDGDFVTFDSDGGPPAQTQGLQPGDQQGIGAPDQSEGGVSSDDDEDGTHSAPPSKRPRHDVGIPNSGNKG